jgi:hypothetical protein
LYLFVASLGKKMHKLINFGHGRKFLVATVVLPNLQSKTFGRQP